MLRDLTNGLTSLSTDGVAKERCPKFDPGPSRGLNKGPTVWQSEILPTVPSLTHSFGIPTDDIVSLSYLVSTVPFKCTNQSNDIRNVFQ